VPHLPLAKNAPDSRRAQKLRRIAAIPILDGLVSSPLPGLETVLTVDEDALPTGVHRLWDRMKNPACGLVRNALVIFERNRAWLPP
jgi:hypothetical protein